MNCPNCNATMGCSCQKRVTPNGKIGCTKCIGSLTSAPKLKDPNPKPPVIKNVEIFINNQ